MSDEPKSASKQCFVRVVPHAATGKYAEGGVEIFDTIEDLAAAAAVCGQVVYEAVLWPCADIEQRLRDARLRVVRDRRQKRIEQLERELAAAKEIRQVQAHCPHCRTAREHTDLGTHDCERLVCDWCGLSHYTPPA